MLITSESSNGMWYMYKRTTKQRWLSRFELHNLKDKFEIWNLSTIPEQQCKGNAEKMLREFLEQFDFSKPLSLYVRKENTVAIHLYEKIGFKIVGNYYGGDYAYEMRYEKENYYD